MDYLSIIKEPISQELDDFISLFNKALMHEEGLLSSALEHIRNRGGKRMRPMLMLLMAKNFGEVTFVAQHAAVGLELLHTASLVHDDVVDESGERRGQASVNATYNNKVAVLVGDYILSTALLNVAYTQSEDIVRDLAELGRTLSNGEILQLTNISNQEISEEVYYQVINQKTAALFEACAVIGAKAGNASESDVEAARLFGQRIGIIFQIRDDIFDYYDSTEIALKSTGNKQMMALAMKVKEGTVNADEIAQLVSFAKESGGIEYAEKKMLELHNEALQFVSNCVHDEAIANALKAYLDFVIQRKN